MHCAKLTFTSSICDNLKNVGVLKCSDYHYHKVFACEGDYLDFFVCVRQLEGMKGSRGLCCANCFVLEFVPTNS